MALIFIHGAGASPAVWRLQLKHFKGSYAIDLPGHPIGNGLSSVTEYARSVANYIIQQSIIEPVLVGHSMGGTIAIEYALSNSNLKALVLVGTGARLRVRPEFLSELRLNYENACREIATWSVSPSSDPIVGERLANDLMKVNPVTAYNDFSACDKYDRMEDVAKVRCPTLILCGADDRMTPPKYSRYLHEKIVDSELVLIPGAGHSVMLEKHKEFNKALEDFLVSR